MTEKTALHARLDKVRAFINSPELAKRQAEHAKAQAHFERQHEIRKAGGPTTLAQDEEHGYARNAMKNAAAKVESLMSEIRLSRTEAAHLERLLNSGQSLARAQESWRNASEAQVQATKAAEAARENLNRLNALLAEEEGKSQSAKDAQRSAILVKLGFSDKPNGETVNASVKALIGSEANIDALKTARPDVENRVVLADAALVACDKSTRQAEQAILDAKQSIAELHHANALETYRVALVEFHGATLAATGLEGQRITLYNEGSRAAFEQVARSLKSDSEAGC